MSKRIYLTAAIIAIVLVIFAGYSCKTVKQNTDKNTVKVDSNNVECLPILLDTANAFTESDPFLLVNAEFLGNCLMIEVEYDGGCGGDTWTLAWNGMLMKSLPPKANIYLHLKDEDACRSKVRKKLYFDVSSIYNNQEVVLYLKDFRGMLTYKPQ